MLLVQLNAVEQGPRKYYEVGGGTTHTQFYNLELGLKRQETVAAYFEEHPSTSKALSSYYVFSN